MAHDRHDNLEGIPQDDIRFLIAVWACESAARRFVEAGERFAATLGRLGRVMSTQTTTGVSGVPCGGDYNFREVAMDEPLPQPAESHDSSAFIPPEQIEKSDRGGE